MNVMGIWEGIKQTMIMMADDWNQRCGHKLGHLHVAWDIPFFARLKCWLK